MKTSHPFLPRPFLTALTLMAALLATVVRGHAGQTWTGGGSPDFLWGNAANWGGTAPTYGTLTFSGSTGTVNTNDSQTSQNELLWTGTSPWTLNQGGSTVLSLFDNSGTQAKVENDSTGLVTINAPITYAATVGAVWGELNAVSGGITFGSAATLTVNGSQVSYIKMFGAGQTLTLNNTVSATGKAFYTTSASGDIISIGGSVTTGDFFVMNGSKLNLNSGGSLTTTALRLGGDFGTTLTQNQALGATFNLSSTTGGQTFGGLINSVSGNTSGALVVNSQNTSGTNLLTGGLYTDSPLLMTNAVGGTLIMTGAGDIKAQTLTFSPAGTMIVAALTSSLGAGGNIVLTNTGTLLLTNLANSYSGTTAGSLNANSTQIGGGTLGIYGDGSLGTVPGGHYNNIQFTGSGSLQDTLNNITLNANRDIAIASGATATLDSSTNTFTVNGIINGTGGAITKIGTGTLSLTGANTYSGATTVGGGTLLVNSPGSLASGSAVTVKGGGTLGGDGTVNGTVTVVGTIAPGNAASTIGTLTLAGGLTLNTGTLLLDLPNTGTTCDLIAVTGSLVLNGVNYIALNAPNGAVPAGTYTVMTFTAQSGSGTLVFPNGSATMNNATIAVNSGNVQITVGSGGLTGNQDTWAGGVSSLWDTTTANWKFNGVTGTYTSGDAVTFDDTASGNFTVTNTGTSVTPASVVVNNSANNYTLVSTNTGGLGGSTALVKLGPAGLTLTGTNTYSGGTTLNNGTLGSGSTTGTNYCFGTGPVAVNGGTFYPTTTYTFTNALTLNGGKLEIGGASDTVTWSGPITTTPNGFWMAGDNSGNVFNLSGPMNIGNFGTSITNSGNQTQHFISGSISGSGGINFVLNGSRLALSGSNSYSGGTVVNGTAKLNVQNNFAFGTGPVTNNGAIIEEYQANPIITNALTLNGGTLESDYLYNDYTSLTWAGPINVTANSTLYIGGTGSYTTSGVNLTGPVTMNGFTLTSTGTSQYGGNQINGSISGTGTIQVNNHSLTLGGANTFSGTFRAVGGTLSVNNVDALQNATLDMNAADAGSVTVNNLNVVIGALTGTRALSLGSGAVSVGNNNLTTIFTGNLTSTGSFTKIGSGTLSLTNNNLTGIVTVSGGTLVVAQPTFVNSGLTPLTVGGSGVLQLDFDATNAVAALVLNGVAQPAGIYKAANSGGRITGIGAIQVISSPAWTGVSSTSWNTPGNWFNGVIPSPAANVVFNAYSTANLATVLNANFSLGALQFVNPSGPVSIAAGGAFTLTLANGINMPFATQPLSITAPVALGANQTWTVANGQTLTVSGVVSGAFGLTDAGGGTVSLSGANSYTGGTTVSGGGELDFNNWSSSTLGAVTVSSGTLGISGSATYNLGGNTLAVSSSGNGTVNQPSGIVSITGGNAVLLGNTTAGVTGTYNLSGGSLTTGSFSSSTRGVMIGANNSCKGIFNLSGTGNLALANAELAVGRDDAGATGCTVAYNQNGGTATVGYLSIGGQSGATKTTASFNLTNGTFTATNFQHFVAAANSSATLYLGGGAQVTLPAFPVKAGTANVTFDFTNGFLSPYAASASYMPAGTFNNAYLTTNGVNFNVASANSITVGQVLTNAPSQAGTLTKSGSGTLTLSGANTYTGNTTVSAGTLALTGGGSISSSPQISIATNATFDLSGVTSGYSLSTALAVNINKTGATLTQGQVAIGGKALTYGGTLTVVPNANSDAFAAGNSFPLVTKTSGTLNGWFSSVTVPALNSGLAWDTNDLATAGLLDVYTFTTTPLAFWTPTNTAATIAAAKLANHVSSAKLPAAYPALGWSATATTPANGGSVVVNADGSLNYTPAGAANVNGGTDSFTVTFYDGHGWQTMAVTVTVGTSSSGGQSPNVVNSGTDVSGNFYALFAGLPNTPYTVETNSLVTGGTWVKYANYTTGGDGLISVTNVPPVGGSLYFRTVYPSY